MTLDLHDRIPVILDQRGFSEWLDEGAVAARIGLGEQVHDPGIAENAQFEV